MYKLQNILIMIAVFCISGCATIPPGPSVMVLPAQGKSFEEFRADDLTCRDWAETQTGWKANDTVNQNLAAGAAIGTVLGAGLGAAIGSASGHVGAGAGIGAATGLAAGTAIGGDQAQASGHEVQRRYDNAYKQCMYSKGNQVSGVVVHQSGPTYYPPPPPPNYGSAPPPPPPSAGAYPPPPPPPY